MKINSLILLLFISSITWLGCAEKTPQEQKKEIKEDQKEAYIKTINSLEAKIFDNNDSEKDINEDRKNAHLLLQNYTEYYNRFPNDPKSADFLFKAGNLALGLGKPRQAIKLFRTTHDGFPSYNKKVEALNMVAFIYDTKLHQKDEARAYYQFIITNYPDHKLAKDAEAAIRTLEMTDEELIEYFKKKNANNSKP